MRDEMNLVVNTFYKDFNDRMKELRARTLKPRHVKQLEKASQHLTKTSESNRAESLTESSSSFSKQARVDAWVKNRVNSTSGC